MSDFTLTEGQYRHLFVNLSSLHKETTELIDRLRADRSAGRAWRESVIKRLEAVKDDLEKLSDETGIPLERQEVPLEREIGAWASIWWSRILDCRPHALKGYGKVDEKLAALLAPSIKRLSEALLRIGQKGG